MAFDPDSEERTNLISELERLRGEHRALDERIGALESEGTVLPLEMQRMKKRKLALKDRISYLEDRLTPDIIA